MDVDAGIKQDRPSPRKVSPKQVAYALERMKAMLLDPDLGYGEQLLRFLEEDIRVEVGQITLRGNVATCTSRGRNENGHRVSGAHIHS